MLKKSNRLILIATFVWLLAIIVWLGWALPSRLAGSGNQPRQTPGASITVSGLPICLPHRDSSGPQTLECAIGIKTDDGQYYALTPIGNIQFSQRLTVTGVLTTKTDSRYLSSGTITISSYSQ